MHLVQYVDLTSSFDNHLKVAICDDDEFDSFIKYDGSIINILNSLQVKDQEVFIVIVAGSRTFNDYALLIRSLDHLLQYKKYVVIVSGAAPGADSLGEKYAKGRGHFIHQFLADWN